MLLLAPAVTAELTTLDAVDAASDLFDQMMEPFTCGEVAVSTVEMSRHRVTAADGNPDFSSPCRVTQ